MASDSTKLLIDATYRVQADDVDAYKALALRMAKAALKRDGCVFLKVAQDVDDPTTFYLLEGWRDQDALNAHIASDDMQGVLREVGKLKIADRFADAYVVSGSTPVAMPS